MAGSWGSFLFLVGSFSSARCFSGLPPVSSSRESRAAPGRACWGVESVGRSSLLLSGCHGRWAEGTDMSSPAAIRTRIHRLISLPLVFTLEVHGSILEGQMK